jgi:hypothetical protein
VLSASSAAGQEGAEEANYDPPTERRGGFVVGLGLGFGVGNYSGYPNEGEDINNPESHSTTGTSFSNQSSIWIGGALRDWFTFGAGFFRNVANSDDLSGQGFTIGTHLEAFPLYALGGLYRDLGLATEFGAGGGAIFDSENDETANGGSMSTVGVGAFFEPWQFWQMSTGPSMMYTHQFSRSLKVHSFVLGWRAVLYTGQP